MIKVLIQLFCTLFKVGLCTFGGGIAMLPILETELVEKRGWTTSEELLDWFAIGQSTPGIIAVNVSTFVGHKKAGVLGACIATLGMVTPCLIIITIIALCIGNFADIVWVQKAMMGVNVAVAAILTSAVYKFAKKSVKNIAGAVLFVISFLLIFVLNVNTIWIILGSSVIGVIISGIRGDYKKGETK